VKHYKHRRHRCTLPLASSIPQSTHFRFHRFVFLSLSIPLFSLPRAYTSTIRAKLRKENPHRRFRPQPDLSHGLSEKAHPQKPKEINEGISEEGNQP
jgi:hypothetical protein